MDPNSEVLVCPSNRDWSLTMDPAQVFPEDPGLGTPLLVEGPGGSAGTYYCAIEMGVCDCVEIPPEVYRWLDSQEVTDEIVAFWNEVEAISQ